MPTPDDRSKRPFPWTIKLLIILAIVVIIPAGILSILGHAATARWNRYAAKLRAGGDPLTLVEIDAQRTVIPDELNGALVIERLRSQLDDLQSAYPDRLVFLFARRSSETDFFTGIPRDSIIPSREFIETHGELLAELSALRDMPTGRVDLQHKSNPLATLLPWVPHVRVASKLLSLNHMLELIDGDLSGAVETMRLHSRLSATLNECPTVIGRLVQLAVDAQLVRAIENTLRVAELNERQLHELIGDMKARLDASSMKWAFLGERAFFVDTCDALAASRITSADITRGGSGPAVFLPYLPDLLIRENQMRGAEILTWLVDAADDPAAMTKAGQRLDREVPALPRTQAIVKTILPSLSRSVILHLRSRAVLECAKVALSAERFRLVTGELPDSIETLVPDYLDAVPTDPFDGKPMRFAVTENGIVVYSISEDLDDDGGIVARQRNRPRYLDVGFRLFKPEHRGLLLIDAPPQDDE